MNPFDPTAPKEVVEIYNRAYAEHKPKGHPEAHKRALRMVSLGGWYKGGKGWSQKHPDLTNKVAIREAVQQPDGRFVIENVPCFYPSAVKGKESSHSADDINRYIQNTNRMIASGAQKPALVEGHPDPGAAMLGMQSDSLGSPVNWRAHPTRKGWAMCDLVDVVPEIVSRMKDRKITGLSVGLAKDANNLNKRFGHVALLGGTTQALSQLPATEVFASNLNFSADTETFPQGNPMKLNDKQKACFKAMKDCYDAYEAAEESEKVGEPGADEKVKEAFAACMAKKGEFDAAMSEDSEPGNPTNGSPMEPNLSAPANSANAAELSAPESDTPPDDSEYAAITDAAIIADPLPPLQKMREFIQRQGRVLKAMLVQNRFRDFSAACDELRRTGRPVPAGNDLRTEFDLCFAARDIEKAEKALTYRLEQFKCLAPNRTAATVNNGTNDAFFSADDEPRRPAQRAATAKDLEKVLPSMTKEQMEFAALVD